jgi:cell division protein FtsB
VTRTRWLVVGVIGIAVVFAVQGGEYSTWNWLDLRGQEHRQQDAVARLQVEVDSLTKVAEALDHDPRVQERVARESFGMIGKGEFLYKLVPADSGER